MHYAVQEGGDLAVIFYFCDNQTCLHPAAFIGLVDQTWWERILANLSLPFLEQNVYKRISSQEQFDCTVGLFTPPHLQVYFFTILHLHFPSCPALIFKKSIPLYAGATVLQCPAWHQSSRDRSGAKTLESLQIRYHLFSPLTLGPCNGKAKVPLGVMTLSALWLKFFFQRLLCLAIGKIQEGGKDKGWWLGTFPRIVVVIGWHTWDLFFFNTKDVNFSGLNLST